MDEDINCKTTLCCMSNGSWAIKTIIDDVNIIQNNINAIKALIKDDPQNCLRDFNILARVRYYYSSIEHIAGASNTLSKSLEEDLIRYELWNKNKNEE